MNMFINIPMKHHYYRYLEFLRLEQLKRNMLKTIFLITFGVYFLFFVLSSIFNISIDPGIYQYCNLNLVLDYISQEPDEFLFFLLSCIFTVIVPYLTVKLYNTYSYSLFYQYLHLWCQCFIKKGLLSLILDPYLIHLYEGRKRTRIHYFNLNLNQKIHHLSKNYQAHNLFLTDMILKRYSRIFINQYPELFQHPMLRKMRLRNGILISIIVFLSLILFALTIGNDFLESKYPLLYYAPTPYYILPPLITILFYGSKLAIESAARKLAIKSIINIVFFRDPVFDVPLVNYFTLNPRLKYEKVVEVINSYLYPEKGKSDIIIPT